MICRSRRVSVVCVVDFVICYFCSTPVIKIASACLDRRSPLGEGVPPPPKPWRRRACTAEALWAKACQPGTTGRRLTSQTSLAGRRHVTVESFVGEERATESPRAGLRRVRDAAGGAQRLVRDLPAATRAREPPRRKALTRRARATCRAQPREA